MNHEDYIKAFQITLDEIIDSKFDMSINWTERFENALEGAVDVRFKEFVKELIKRDKK